MQYPITLGAECSQRASICSFHKELEFFHSFHAFLKNQAELCCCIHATVATRIIVALLHPSYTPVLVLNP